MDGENGNDIDTPEVKVSRNSVSLKSLRAWLWSHVNDPSDPSKFQNTGKIQRRCDAFASCGRRMLGTMKPVYNDRLMGYFSAFWSSSRWPLAT